MRIQLGDTIIFVDGPRRIGIVERRQGDILTVRVPVDENRREQVSRRQVRTLAEVICLRHESAAPNIRTTSALPAGQPLQILSGEFGFATQRLRSESLDRVVRQLQRAGLEVHPETERWSRDDRFKLVVAADVSPESEERR